MGVSLILCYNQAINDCFDIEIDKTKQEFTGKELIISKVISRRTAFVLTFSVLFIGLASTALTSFNLFIVASAMAFLGTIYSAPPFRLKMKYPFSTLVQFVGCFLPFLAGVVAFSPITYQAIIISSLFAMLAIAHRFEHEIQNYAVDLKTGKKTVAIVNGLEITKVLYKASILAGVAEFIVSFAAGWLNGFFLLLFTFYLFLSIIPPRRFLSKPLKKIIIPMTTVSGFVLFFFAVFLIVVF